MGAPCVLVSSSWAHGTFPSLESRESLTAAELRVIPLPPPPLFTPVSSKLQSTMSTAACWDARAKAGYDQSYYGRFCAGMARQVVDSFEGPGAPFKVLDVGTGSGIVPMLLAAKFPEIQVMSGKATRFVGTARCRPPSPFRQFCTGSRVAVTLCWLHLLCLQDYSLLCPSSRRVAL